MTTITTRMGSVNGATSTPIENDDTPITRFLGIRYADAPLGERRFLAPTPVEPWSGTLEATTLPNRAVQPAADTSGPLASAGPETPMSEDCLFLNCFTPAAFADGRPDRSDRPVLVWIHGGAFQTGSANSYDGSVLAGRGDAVVVAINYRLGILGFSDLSEFGEHYVGSGSNGFRDQICALEWVRDNIADYGGDAGNVTIFGESAGGGSVFALLATPAADGLYHRAISHSGPGVSRPTNPAGPPIAAALDVDVDDVLDRLLVLSPDEIVALQVRGQMFGPGVDGVVVTRPPTDAIRDRGERGVPLIAGSNKDEGTLFGALGGADGATAMMTVAMATGVMRGENPTGYLERLREAEPDLTDKELLVRVWTDVFRRPAIATAEVATEAGPGGWLYRFDLPTTAFGGTLGATHACEIPFTFDSFSLRENRGLAMHDGNDPEVRSLARRWSDAVLRFARTGDPNGGDLPDWPRFADGGHHSLVLDREIHVAADLDRAERAVWGDT